MRKPLIASATACLLTACLAGCGGPSSDAENAEKLQALIDKMAQLESAVAPIAGNQLVYTRGKVVDGVTIPGSYTPDTAFIDQSLALLTEAEAIAAAGNTRQQQTANAIIASIKADEAMYLIGASQEGFQRTKMQVGNLRQMVNVLREIGELNSALSGDRAEIIDTIRSGEVGNGQSVEGIQAFQARASAAAAAASDARQRLEQITAEIEQLREKVAEYEGLELTLSNESFGARGDTRFEKMDRAVDAAYEAQLAESQADRLALDAELTADQAELAEGVKQNSEAVVAELETKVDAVEAERQAVADRLAELDAMRSEVVQKLTEDFNQLDNKIKVLGFARMAEAKARLTEAEQKLAAAGTGGASQLDLLSLYTLKARVLHQQVTSARAYAAALDTLAAAGPDVIGNGLHLAIQTRTSELAGEIEAYQAAAAELQTVADDTVSSVEASADPEAESDQLALELAGIYRSLLGSATAE